MAEAVSAALLLAEDMLSFATCVIGAAFAFLGHVLLYHEDRLIDPSWLGRDVEDAGLGVGCEAPVLASNRASAGGDSFCRFAVRSAGAMGGLAHDSDMSIPS